MIIGPYKDSDFAGVERLWRNCFADDPPRNHASQAIPQKLALGETLGRNLLLVARNDEGAVIGTVNAGYDGHRGWLYAVAVAPGERRGGVGKALIERAISSLKELGCNKVNLQIREGNEAVAAFYEALGFSVEPRTSMGQTI